MSDEIVNEEVAEAPKRGRAVAKTNVVETELITKFTGTMTTNEYDAYSKSNGRIMGRLPDEKTLLTPEEFVVLAKSDWTPKMMMDKHGINLEELQAVARKVGLIQQLARPITVTNTQIRF